MAGLRMVGVTLHQSSVIVANLYLALITAQWVSTNTTHSSEGLKYYIFELQGLDVKPYIVVKSKPEKKFQAWTVSNPSTLRYRWSALLMELTSQSLDQRVILSLRAGQVILYLKRAISTFSC